MVGRQLVGMGFLVAATECKGGDDDPSTYSRCWVRHATSGGAGRLASTIVLLHTYLA